MALWPRWRATRQALQTVAEQAGFRWAIPASVSRRAFLGSTDLSPKPAKAVIEDLSKATGLTAEMIHDVLVIHAPNEARRRELLSRVAGGDRLKRLDALCELGWLKDARVWPELAKMAVGDELAEALAAAQALRRLDGEEDLDWRIIGVSTSDPEFGVKTRPWQAPIGLAFPECVSVEAVEKLASSQYVPLREAAARLTPGLVERGKELAEGLARDPSLVVRAAAKRSLGAWAEPQKMPPPYFGRSAKPDSLVVTDLEAAEAELRRAKAHEDVWRLVGRRLGYTGTPEALRVLLDYGATGARWSQFVTIPLAEFGGGPEALAWLRRRASGGDGFGIWGLSALEDGEDLAGSLEFLLRKGQPQWDAPPEFTAARWAGIHALEPLLRRTGLRGHWACLALGHIGGPTAVEMLAGKLGDRDPGVAVAAAKGLGETLALDAVKPLIAQLTHPDRLRRHWAVLGLGRIGGPDAVKALTDLVTAERERGERLVGKAAAGVLREVGGHPDEVWALLDEFDTWDRTVVPEYRPRNPRFDGTFPVNTEVTIREHAPRTYASTSETQQVMDWANRLLIRYGGGPPCSSNECFAFDVGTAAWFPLRAASHFIGWNNELRPNPGASRAMAYDSINRLVWIGAGTGAPLNPGVINYGQQIGLAAYDAVLDRFALLEGAASMPQHQWGEPAKGFAFDFDNALVISSKSGLQGINVLDVRTRVTSTLKAPDAMHTLDYYPAPAFAYDPVAKVTMNLHPASRWRTLLYDAKANTWRWAKAARFTAYPDIQVCGGMVYDSLNRAMLLIGGVDRDRNITMPTYLYDRQAEAWVDLKVKGLGGLQGGEGHTIYDPEHNVFLGLGGGAYRYKDVPVGTKAFYGGG